MKRLSGARVAVTRPEGRADELCARLEAEGAEPILCPTIRIEPAESFEELERALARLAGYRWLVFTSANAVEAVLGRARRLHGSVRALGGTRVACVGAATAGALEAQGVSVDYAPDDFTGRRLGETLEPVKGVRILFPRGDLGGASLLEALRARGADVDDVVVYRTLGVPPPAACRDQLERGVDALTFTSPSTVRGFVELGPGWREVVRDAIVASIGPSTSAALREAGLDDWVEAREHTAEGLVDALAEAFARVGGNEERGGGR